MWQPAAPKIKIGKERIDKKNKRRTISRAILTPEPDMPQNAAPTPEADADRLEAATDQAIAVCGGNARDAVRAARPQRLV